MRAPSLTLMFGMLMLSCMAQAGKSDTSIKSATNTHGFANEGEQQDWWAMQAFTKGYKPGTFIEYRKAIKVEGNAFIYDKQVIKVYASPELKLLFKNGVFYPSLLLYADDGLPRSLKIRMPKGTIQSSRSDDTIPVKTLKSVFNPDSLVVSAFEELKPLETSPKQRRFRFLVNIEGFLNPTLYFVELSNDEATSATDLTAFTKNARITFLRKGSLII